MGKRSKDEVIQAMEQHTAACEDLCTCAGCPYEKEDDCLGMIRDALEYLKQEDWETAYMTGFEYGYQRAVVDMIKKLRGMKTYGGTYKAKRTAEVPEGAGRAEKPVQRKIRRKIPDEGHGKGIP